MPRFIECDCDGGTYVYDFGEIDRHDGSIIEHSRRCERCDGTGEIEIEDEPIELEDLAEMSDEAPPPPRFTASQMLAHADECAALAPKVEQMPFNAECALEEAAAMLRAAADRIAGAERLFRRINRDGVGMPEPSYPQRVGCSEIRAWLGEEVALAPSEPTEDTPV